MQLKLCLTSARGSLMHRRAATALLSTHTLHPPAIGSELIASLYSYRSIARALPSVTGSEAHRKATYTASFYTASFEVRWTARLPNPSPEAPNLTPLTFTPLTRHPT